MVYLDSKHWDYDQYHNLNKIISFLPMGIASTNILLTDLTTGLRDFDLKEVIDRDQRGSTKLIGRCGDTNVEITKPSLSDIKIVSTNRVTNQRTEAMISNNHGQTFCLFKGILSDVNHLHIVRQAFNVSCGDFGTEHITGYAVSHEVYEQETLRISGIDYRQEDISDYLGKLWRTNAPKLEDVELSAKMIYSSKEPLGRASGVYEVKLNEEPLPFTVASYTDEVMHDLDELVFHDKPVIYHK